MRTGNVILQSHNYEAPVWNALQQLPVSPTTCATACSGSRKVGRDDADAQEQPLVDLADLLRPSSRPAPTCAAASEKLLVAPTRTPAARGRPISHFGCCGRLVAAAGAAGGHKQRAMLKPKTCKTETLSVGFLLY